MRGAPTTGERELWRLLRGRKLEGLKFRRQAPVGPYIVDFVCLDRRLVVEVDGYFHRFHVEHDERRDARFSSEGYRVLRIPDSLIGRAPEEILRLVRAAVTPIAEVGATPHPTPSGATFSPKREKGLARTRRRAERPL
jgi:very-short-patch-repair endonuclease